MTVIMKLWLDDMAIAGLEAWASGNMEKFGELVSSSGLSSIRNYECGKKNLYVDFLSFLIHFIL